MSLASLLWLLLPLKTNSTEGRKKGRKRKEDPKDFGALGPPVVIEIQVLSTPRSGGSPCYFYKAEMTYPQARPRTQEGGPGGARDAAFSKLCRPAPACLRGRCSSAKRSNSSFPPLDLEISFFIKRRSTEGLKHKTTYNGEYSELLSTRYCFI